MKYFFILLLVSNICLCQTSSENGWERIIITRNADDIKGFTKIAEISADAKKLYGNQSKLREEATIKLKKEATKLGASIVLIQVDNFSMSPINNISLIGVAYSNRNTAISSNVTTNSLPVKTSKTEPSVPKNSGSVADELLKFKQLVDSGFMTREEFETQKKRLLNQQDNVNIPSMSNNGTESKSNSSSEKIILKEVVQWNDLFNKTWTGEIKEIKENLAYIKTSDRGIELIKTANVQTLSKIKIDSTINIPKFSEENLLDSIKIGDKIEILDNFNNKWIGIYIGLNEGKVCIKTTQRGMIIVKEITINRDKFKSKVTKIKTQP